MKPNPRNYASYNNYWYALRTYYARLNKEPALPEEITEVVSNFRMGSASAQRGASPAYINEDWLWYGVTNDGAINEVILEMNIPIAPEGYRIKKAVLKTAVAPPEVYRMSGWSELWATYSDVDDPMEAFIILGEAYPNLVGYAPYKGEGPLALELYGLPDEGTTGYLTLMEYNSVITNDNPATPGPVLRFEKDFSIEYTYELIPDEEEV